jgi:valyl-tRNA synthetase
VEAKFDLVTKGRNLRREANIPAGKKVKYVLKPASELPPHDSAVLKLLLNAESLTIAPDFVPPKGTPMVRHEIGDLFLPLEGLVDLAAEAARIRKDLEKLELEIVKQRERLANPAFVQKVPPEVLAEHQKRLTDMLAKQDHLKNTLSGLEGV